MIERWTEFQGSPNRSGREETRVTLNAKGIFLLNQKAYEALGMPAAVKLLYDEDRRCIGMMPHDAQRTNAFPVKQKDKWYNRIIHAKPFFRHFGIDIRRTVLFNEIDIDGEGMMRLELNGTVTIGRTENQR